MVKPGPPLRRETRHRFSALFVIPAICTYLSGGSIGGIDYRNYWGHIVAMNSLYYVTLNDGPGAGQDEKGVST